MLNYKGVIHLYIYISFCFFSCLFGFFDHGFALKSAPSVFLRTDGWNGHEHGDGRSVALHVALSQSTNRNTKGNVSTQGHTLSQTDLLFYCICS